MLLSWLNWTATLLGSGGLWLRLKVQLAERDQAAKKSDEALPKSDSLKKSEPKVADGERKIEIPLPSDQDVDRMMSFVERAWRRLIDMANRVQKDVSGKI